MAGERSIIRAVRITTLDDNLDPVPGAFVSLGGPVAVEWWTQLPTGLIVYSTMGTKPRPGIGAYSLPPGVPD